MCEAARPGPEWEASLSQICLLRTIKHFPQIRIIQEGTSNTSISDTSSGKLILSGVMSRKINRSLVLIGGGGGPCLNKNSFTVEINFQSNKFNFENIVILNPGLLKVNPDASLNISQNIQLMGRWIKRGHNDWKYLLRGEEREFSSQGIKCKYLPHLSGTRNSPYFHWSGSQYPIKLFSLPSARAVGEQEDKNNDMQWIMEIKKH